jgi:hypothetical protein
MPEQFKEFVFFFETNEQRYHKIMLHHCLNFDSYSIFIQIVKGGGTDWFAVLQGETSDVCKQKKAKPSCFRNCIPNIRKLLTP